MIDDNWDDGVLGKDEQFASRAPKSSENELDKIDTEQMIEKIVGELFEKCIETDDPEMDRFFRLTRDDLIDYHHTLGQDIRNEYQLWTIPWVPELVDGVDQSPYHPDAISMSIVIKLWERGQV